MLTLIFISSGLFLGWSLGANDAANIFGSAVGSRMVKFSKAAIIASIFVILGAVIQGSGTTNTLSELGSVDALGGAFTVALCSAIIVAIMTKFKLPVSTGQAIVGAIMGWCYFTDNPVDYSVLSVIAGSWVIGPILGAIFSALLYLLLRRYIRRSKIHLLKLDSIIRNSLIVVGAFGAYSLGANNIANVMGVFVNTISFTVNFGSFNIDSTILLFLMGGVAIAIGILTYSKKVMETVGSGILALTPENAIVVVLAQALVLFIFSSTSLSNFVQSIGLPPIPMVPVSSTQVVVGSVLGIGLIKGIREVKFKMLFNIMIGWVLTPILSGILTFFSLFFISRVFALQVTSSKIVGRDLNNSTVKQVTEINISDSLLTILILILSIAILAVIGFIVLKYRRYSVEKVAVENKWTDSQKFSEMQKSLNEIEVNAIQMENSKLVQRLEQKKKELVTYSLNIGEQRKLLDSICRSLENIANTEDSNLKDQILRSEIIRIKQKMSFSSEVDQIYREAEKVYFDFTERLSTKFPDLTIQEKRLMMLIRIGFSSKEIAPILNISPKSVEISRFRLRKRLQLPRNINLTDFTNNL